MVHGILQVMLSSTRPPVMLINHVWTLHWKLTHTHVQTPCHRAARWCFLDFHYFHRETTWLIIPCTLCLNMLVLRVEIQTRRYVPTYKVLLTSKGYAYIVPFLFVPVKPSYFASRLHKAHQPSVIADPITICHPQHDRHSPYILDVKCVALRVQYAI